MQPHELASLRNTCFVTNKHIRIVCVKHWKRFSVGQDVMCAGCFHRVHEPDHTARRMVLWDGSFFRPRVIRAVYHHMGPQRSACIPPQPDKKCLSTQWSGLSKVLHIDSAMFAFSFRNKSAPVMLQAMCKQLSEQ